MGDDQTGSGHIVNDRGEVVCNHGIPAVCASWTGNAPGQGPGPVTHRSHQFDAFGRAFKTIERLDTTYETTLSFDRLGRRSIYQYPSGLRLRYTYSEPSE